MMEQIEINLGIDIGTKFCYAGFYNDEGHFIPLVSKESIYGIPADVVKPPNGASLLYGDFVKKWKDEQPNDVSDAWYPKESLKTLVRTHLGDFETCSLKIKENEFILLKDIVKGFIDFFIKRILDALNDQKLRDNKNYRISTITFGYPDPPPSGDNHILIQNKKRYEEIITEIIKEVVSSRKNTFKQFLPNIPEIFVKPESVIDGDLMRAISQAVSTCGGNNLKDIVLTVDIGAGTTDFCLLKKSEDSSEYDATYINSANFGGDDVDNFLCSQNILGKTYSQEALISAKKLLFDRENYGEDYMLRSLLQSSAYVMTLNDARIDKTEAGDFLTTNGIRSRVYYQDGQQVMINYDRVIEEFKNYSDNHYELFTASIIDSFNYIKKNFPNKGLSIILMGGSSRLPFIRDDIIGLIQTYNRKWEIRYIEDNELGGAYGINNANFIAFGAALYQDGTEIKTLKRTQSSSTRSSSSSTPKPAKVQMVEPLKATNYSSYTYGIKAANNEGYYIIVNRGISNTTEVETNMPQQYMFVSDRTRGRYNIVKPNELVGRIYLRNSNLQCEPGNIIYPSQIARLESCYNETMGEIEVRRVPVKLKTIYRFNAPIDQQMELYFYYNFNVNPFASIKEGQIVQNFK